MEKININYDENIDYKYILLTFDDNYLNVASCLIKSLILNTSYNLCFIVFAEHFSEETISKLEKLKSSFIIYYIDKNILNITYDESKHQWPYISFVRLLAPFIIEEKMDYLYYLDGDMLCINKLDEMFEVRFNQSVALCPEFQFSVHKLHSPELSNSRLYCNSGFIIFNMLSYCSKYDLKSLSYALNEKLDSLSFPDQDFINIYFKDDLQCLNTFKYNNMTYQYKGNGRFKNIIGNTIIIHCAFYKPWNNKCVLNFSKIYKKFCPDEQMRKQISKCQIQYLLLYPFRFVIRVKNKVLRILKLKS